MPEPALPPGSFSCLPPLLGEVLVRMAFAPLEDVAAWMERLGCTVTWNQDQTHLLIRNPWHPILTALASTTRPPDRVPILGFALCGRVWPWVFPGLYAAVNDALTRRKHTEGGRHA